ncbi:hypothetical protein J6590_076764 [Homalodisca vitripennis]|nr:hypothetical protein J6590_076764 [Homalodisca vitripennis]
MLKCFSRTEQSPNVTNCDLVGMEIIKYRPYYEKANIPEKIYENSKTEPDIKFMLKCFSRTEQSPNLTTSHLGNRNDCPLLKPLSVF